MSPEMAGAVADLIAHIEGIGCVTYLSPDGRRLKESNEWARFYVAAKNAQRGPVTPPTPRYDETFEQGVEWLSETFEQRTREARGMERRVHELLTEIDKYKYTFHGTTRYREALQRVFDLCADELQAEYGNNKFPHEIITIVTAALTPAGGTTNAKP